MKSKNIKLGEIGKGIIGKVEKKSKNNMSV